MTDKRKISPKALAEHYLDLLTQHRGLTEHDPQSNPVKLLAFDISHDIETGEATVTGLKGLAKYLSDQALIDRADRLKSYLGDCTRTQALAAFEDMVRREARDEKMNFETFAERWQRTSYGLVLTAHPTFALPTAMRQVLADVAAAANDGERQRAIARLDGLAHAPDADISLDLEHNETQKALANVQSAIEALAGRILAVARDLYPLQWAALVPAPMTVASWVGYDIDGRSDIRWWDSIRFRLAEKASQLDRLCAAAGALPKTGSSNAGPYTEAVGAICNRLASGAKSAARDRDAFAADLSDNGAFRDAANRLTGGDSDRLITMAPVLDLIDPAIATAPDDEAREALILLKCDMVRNGLGTGHIHLRVNAIQMRNAMREYLDISGDGVVQSRLAIARLTKMIAEVKPVKVNFGTLDHEQTTARRQFMLMAEIVKHIDAQTPIRFLIAECESPFAILAAIYFARLFGVEEQVDISPLFETPAALERGGRLIEQLLDNPAYMAYARKRGRIAIQTGFSDAGRFFGQIPAGLAIERLQIQLARHMAARGIDDIEALIFNTHGESVGRGCHPSGLKSRQHYVMTPWARWNFARANIALKHETSFQGGDGFVALSRPDLACMTVAGLAMAETPPKPMEVEDDPFYSDIAFTWDFYRALRAWQQNLFEDHDYRAAIGAFGTHLLHRTGSRQTRRPDSDRPTSLAEDLSRIRAIPHNAILQQLGYAANAVAGIGLAASSEFDRFVELARRSPRMGMVMEMVAFSKRQSSLTAMAAYGAIFDGGFWVARAYGRSEPGTAEACLTLARLVRDNARFNAISRLQNRLRTDAISLHAALDEIGLDGGQKAGSPLTEKDQPHLLHAVRLALIMRLVLLAARLPDFSARGDVTREAVLELLVGMRVPEAAAILRDVFPATEAEGRMEGLIEPSSYETGKGRGYPKIHSDYIRPMEEIYNILKDIGVGLSHRFGAYG